MRRAMDTLLYVLRSAATPPTRGNSPSGGNDSIAILVFLPWNPVLVQNPRNTLSDTIGSPISTALLG